MPSQHRPRHHHRSPQATPEQLAASRRRHILWLSLLVLVVYASALGGGFVWSDREDILEGGHRLTGLADVPLALSLSRPAYRLRNSGAEVDGAAGSWQPLTLASNSLSWSLWGDCAFCFHAENLLLHGLTVIGLYALGRRLLTRQRHGQRVAVWAAALYAIHPATVPTVAWIGGRAYLLAAVFGIWSLVWLCRLREKGTPAPVQARFWLLLIGLSSTAAMLAHETAYLLPLAALLVAAHARWGADAWRRPLPPFLAGVGLLLIVLAGVLAYRGWVLGGLSFGADYPTDSIVRNAGMVLLHLWYFIDQTLLPFEPTVSDARPIIAGWGATETAALLGTLLILAGTLIGFVFRHPSAFGVAWFLLWLLPGLGILPSTHYHSSHTFYLASWGLVFAVSYALFRLWRPIGRQLVSGSEGLLFVPFILYLGIVTAFSNARWWDQNGLFAGEIANDPHYIVGRLELAKTALKAGDPQTAHDHVMAAFEASNDAKFTGYWSQRDAFFLLGRAQWDLGDPDAAARSFGSALEARPGDLEAGYWLGVAQLAQNDYTAAEVSLRRLADGGRYAAEASADLGAALVGQERYAEALPLLREAMAQGRGNVVRHRAYALALIDAGEFEEAALQLDAALADREIATERARLAWVNWRLGRVDQAREDLNMALQLEDAPGEYVHWVRRQLEGPPPVADEPR